MMRHLTVMMAALLVSVLLLGTTVAISSRAASERARVTAVFPPGADETEIFLRVAAAGGRIIRGTLLPFAVEVAGDEAGIAGRLAEQGAWLVLAELPAHALALGGCSYMPAASYEPTRAKLAAGSL